MITLFSGCSNNSNNAQSSSPQPDESSISIAYETLSSIKATVENALSIYGVSITVLEQDDGISISITLNEHSTSNFAEIAESAVNATKVELETYGLELRKMNVCAKFPTSLVDDDYPIVNWATSDLVSGILVDNRDGDYFNPSANIDDLYTRFGSTSIYDDSGLPESLSALISLLVGNGYIRYDGSYSSGGYIWLFNNNNYDMYDDNASFSGTCVWFSIDFSDGTPADAKLNSVLYSVDDSVLGCISPDEPLLVTRVSNDAWYNLETEASVGDALTVAKLQVAGTAITEELNKLRIDLSVYQ